MSGAWSGLGDYTESAGSIEFGGRNPSVVGTSQSMKSGDTLEANGIYQASLHQSYLRTWMPTMEAITEQSGLP